MHAHTDLSAPRACKVTAMTATLADAIRLYRAARERFDSAGLKSAERAFRRLLPERSDDSETYFYLGATLATQSRHTEAAAVYATSVSLDPSSHPAAENLAIALDEAGRTRQAAAAYERVLAFQPATDAKTHAALGKLRLQLGETANGAAHLDAAMALLPRSASTHYEAARATQLFGGPHGVNELFGRAQELAMEQWRGRMACAPPAASSSSLGATGGGAAAQRVEVLAEGGARYGRAVPLPHSSARAWARAGRGAWPSLRFVERATVLRVHRDVWLSGNDAVASDDACNVFLPSHGVEVPLHLNLPMETPTERHEDGRVRHAGTSLASSPDPAPPEEEGQEEGGTAGPREDGGEEETKAGSGEEAKEEDDDDDDEEEIELVLNLGQLFFANYYSFLADALSRLVVAWDALSPEQRDRTKVVLPTDRGALRPWMWPLLEMVGVSRANSYPYPVRPTLAGAADAAAARMRVRRLVVVDWEEAPHHPTLDGRNDTHHLPSRHALRLLRARLAPPGAEMAWASAVAGAAAGAAWAPPRRRLLVYLHRAAARLRVVSNEAELIEAVSSELGGGTRERVGDGDGNGDASGGGGGGGDGGGGARAPGGWRFAALSDSPPTPLQQAMGLMRDAGAVLGTHGAGWANLVFCGPGAAAIEMALPEPHAVYAAHLAHALDLSYWWLPLTGHGLHSAPTVVAPVARARRVVRKVVAAAEATASTASSSTTADAATSTATATATATSTTSAQPAGNSSFSSDRAVVGVELVVPRHQEDWRWCAALAQRRRGLRVTIYNKGHDPHGQEAAEARALFGAGGLGGGNGGGHGSGGGGGNGGGNGGGGGGGRGGRGGGGGGGGALFSWVQLPNIGRESHTFLTHVVRRWRRLAPRTVFMQAAPWDHLLPGLGVDAYLDGTRGSAAGGGGGAAGGGGGGVAGGDGGDGDADGGGGGGGGGGGDGVAGLEEELFLPLTAVARLDLQGLAFRDGYAPFAPFTGELIDAPPGAWAARNRRRCAALLQPAGLWGGARGYNRTRVAVPSRDVVAGLPMLRTSLHWIETRQRRQRAPTLEEFWRRYLGRLDGSDAPPPRLLFHAQGAQFAVGRALVARRPYSLYAALLDELRHPDPVASYYLELLWWHIFQP